MNSTKRNYSKQEKEKKPKREPIFGEKLLKIGRIILIVLVGCYLLSFLWTTPHFIFNNDSIGVMIIFFLPMAVSLGVFFLFHRWVLSKRIHYEQYIRGELPPVIRVKALNDRVFQGIVFVLIVSFYTLAFWFINKEIRSKETGELLRYFYQFIAISILIGIIVLFAYDLRKKYRDTFYAIEIRNGILYIFYKETLQQTIDLKSIRYVYFFLKESSRETKIHPRMKVFNGRTFILCIKLSVDNYLLLKAFFTRNNVKITDNYTIL